MNDTVSLATDTLANLHMGLAEILDNVQMPTFGLDFSKVENNFDDVAAKVTSGLDFA